MKKLTILLIALAFAIGGFVGSVVIQPDTYATYIPWPNVVNSQTYYPNAGETDQGATGNGRTIKAYVDAIGTDKKATIKLTHNGTGNTTTYQLSTSETIPSNITLEIENGAVINNDISIRNASYKWTASGSGTSEYYLEAAAGGDPGISEPYVCTEDGSDLTAGTAGSLAAGEWDWADNDTLGYSTVYVRLSDSTDPDGKAEDYVKAGYRITINGPFNHGLSQCFSGDGSVSFGRAAVSAVELVWFPNTPAGFQSAGDAAGDGTLHISRGTYYISEATFTSRYLSIIGDSFWTSELKITSGSDYGIRFDGRLIDNEYKNFYLNGADLNNGGIGIHARYGMRKCKISKIYFCGSGDDTTHNATGLEINGADPEGLGNNCSNFNEIFQCHFYNWRYGLRLHGENVSGGLFDTNIVKLNAFEHNYTHLRIDDGNGNLLKFNIFYKATDGGVERAAGSDRVELDGQYTRTTFEGNYWEEVEDQDAAELTNYSGAGEPIIVIGDVGATLTKYKTNSGEVQYIGRDAVNFATLDVTDGLNERKSFHHVTSANSSYTPSKNDEFIVCNTNDNDITITLPPLANVAEGKTYTFVKISPNNNLIIDGNESERVGDRATVTLTGRLDALTVIKYDSSVYWSIAAFYADKYFIAASTGTGTVKMGSVNNSTSNGWIEVSPGKYVPYWTDPTP